jgi:hypothetical protein
LLDYKEPAGSKISVSAGGMVPDGLTIYDNRGQENPNYKQWRYDTFWKLDLNTYRGQPLSARFVDKEHLNTPWFTPELKTS